MVRGGAQENTLANVLGLHGGEWESTLVTGPALGPEGSMEPRCKAAGVRMLHVPELVREISPRQDRAALARLARILKAERPHLVHTHTSKAGILGRLAARMAGVPAVVHTPHGHVFHSYEGGLKTRLFIRAERTCASWAHRLVALTERERDEHLELRVGRPEQWTTIHSGVNFRPFEAARGDREAARGALGIPTGVPVVGTVGRLVPIKGQRYLIEAAAILSPAFPDLQLLLVGDGELRDELLGLARGAELGVIEHDPSGKPRHAVGVAPGRATVHFLGLRRDVPHWMSAMDIFALPSLNEGMGRVLVEAMAMELPCVASRVSGIPNVVAEGETGLLVPAKESGELAQALSQLLQASELARTMGRKGRGRVVPAFSVEEMVRKLEALYLDVLRERGVPVPPSLGKVSEAELQRRLSAADA